mmetsp:Transcript_15274/g.38854  ORF Transcript_15274/g.38854 Transcript_15274/m.38854 type:complete len:521 (-) Transcript_15274:508-2070(-)
MSSRSTGSGSGRHVHFDSVGNVEIVSTLRGKKVLLTGATGFVGTCVMERLLRSCKVGHLVLLLRGRRGVEPHERLKDLLMAEVFLRLREEVPIEELMKRITVVHADLSMPRLGISEEDWKEVLLKDGGVHYVIHSAASIKLMEPFKKQLQMNFGATADLLELANKMTNMVGFVYVSTAFVNANLPPGSVCVERIQELFKPSYGTKFGTAEYPFRDYHDLVKYFLSPNLADKDADEMARKLMKLWNFWSTYIMTKNWTEQHVKYCHEKKDKYKFQTTIVRPALITSCAKDPYPGYISNNAGPAGMAMAFAHGLLSYSPYKPDRVMDMIPGDFVANTIILGCATMDRSLPSPRILHSSSSVSNPVTIGKYFQLVMEYFDKEPVNQEILRNFFGWRIQNKIRIKFVSGPEKVFRRSLTVGYWKVVIFFAKCISPQLHKAAMMGYGATKLLLNEDVAKGLFFHNGNTVDLYGGLDDTEQKMFPCIWSPVYSWDKYTPIFLEGVKVTQVTTEALIDSITHLLAWL